MIRRIAEARQRAFPKVPWQVAALALLLCLAIPIWGTAYKVSQYHTKDGSSTLPQVKLLPASDGPMKRTLAPLALSTALAGLLWLASAGLQGPARSTIAVVTVSARQPQLQTYWIHALFFRPPPSRR